MKFKIGQAVTNLAVGEFIIVAINTEDDNTLLVSTKDDTLNRYVGAHGLQQIEDGTVVWAFGHYFGNNLQAATEYVFDIQPKKDDIAIIIEDGIVTDVFSTGYHTVEVIDLDVQDYGIRSALDNRVNKIKNSSNYKSIY